METTLRSIAGKFCVPGTIYKIEQLGHGNVNDTYVVSCRTVMDHSRFVLQRINKYVFREPVKLMRNIRVVANHVHQVYEREAAVQDRIWQLPAVIPARNGQDYVVGADGDFWRGLTLIADARAYETIRDSAHAFEVGAVLGRFHYAIGDLSADSLYDTLPGFHITPSYFKPLDEALGTPEGRERVESSSMAEDILEFLEERRDWCGVLEEAKRRGELHLRPIHGDPKTANVMIDDDTEKGICIIDLDTVKPGLIHYDLGDCLRSCCNLLGEETWDFDDVRFDLGMCRSLLQGYHTQSAGVLTDNEREYLFDGVRVIAFEQALRFFADYVAGDVYYKTSEKGQNLRRAKVQMELCKSIESQESDLRRLLSEI